MAVKDNAMIWYWQKYEEEAELASRLAGKQIWGNWKKLPALLVLVWLATENPATGILISFDMNKSVALFCLFVDLLAWGVCAACWLSALLGSLTAERGPAAPRVSPPPEEPVVTQLWLLVFPMYYISSSGILFVFSWGEIQEKNSNWQAVYPAWGRGRYVRNRGFSNANTPWGLSWHRQGGPAPQLRHRNTKQTKWKTTNSRFVAELWIWSCWSSASAGIGQCLKDGPW